MKVPTQPELIHMQFQSMLRDNNNPESEVAYLGQREYTTEYAAHPEYHGQMMHWYWLDNDGSPVEIPVCDFMSIDGVEEDD